MAPDFSSKYAGRTTSSSTKPDCFGDEDYHDPDDPICRDCSSRYACDLVIKRRNSSKRRTTQARTMGSRTTNKDKKTSGNMVSRQEVERYVQTDTDEGETFTGALIHNASLNAVQGALDTASHAWAQIPRKGYKNIFHSARRRRKAVEED